MSKIKAKVKRLDTDVYELICDEYQECYVEMSDVVCGDEVVGPPVYFVDYFKDGNHIESNDFDDLDGVWEYLREDMDLSWETIEKIIFN